MINKKISEIMRRVGYMEKDGYNQAQRYKYLSEAKIVEEIRGVMCDVGVIIVPHADQVDVQVIERGGKSPTILTTIVSTYSFVCADDGDSIQVRVVSQGTDTQDKGAFKSLTGGLKYALKQTFLIPTGDDPEKDDDQYDDEEERKPAPKQKKTGSSSQTVDHRTQAFNSRVSQISQSGDPNLSIYEEACKKSGVKKHSDITTSTARLAFVKTYESMVKDKKK